MPLPTPADFGLPGHPDTVVAVRIPADGLVVYRLVRSKPADINQDFHWNSLAWAATNSVSELLRVAFSHYLTIESAIRVATKPGTWVAELHLVPSPLVHVARTTLLAGGDHVSVWAPRELLAKAIRAYPAGPLNP